MAACKMEKIDKSLHMQHAYGLKQHDFSGDDLRRDACPFDSPTVGAQLRSLTT